MQRGLRFHALYRHPVTRDRAQDHPQSLSRIRLISPPRHPTRATLASGRLCGQSTVQMDPHVIVTSCEATLELAEILVKKRRRENRFTRKVTMRQGCCSWHARRQMKLVNPHLAPSVLQLVLSCGCVRC